MGWDRHVSRIAIIGGGPTGIACAKYLLAEKSFHTIDIFEQRDRVGGVWNLTTNERTRRIPIPQLNPSYGSCPHPCSSQTVNGIGSKDESLEFESPLYDYLETNIPKDLMKYSDTPFPPDFPLFPNHQEVLQYLENYAQKVRHLIQFETQVENVRLANDSNLGQREWLITAKKLSTGTLQKSTYDAIIVASGHYTIPQTPDIEGLNKWNEAFPGVAMHSKAYRNPIAFKAKTVLIIGNSASGIDLAAQIGRHCEKLYLSGRSESIFGQSKVSWREDIDEIVEFLNPKHHERAIRTKSGRIITGLDSVIFATGYFYSYPFLSALNPAVVTDGLRTRNTYQHFILINYPEIAFPVINMKVIPFGLAENQAAVIARLWSGRLAMPPQEEMEQWERRELSLKGDGKHFHVQSFPGDGLQMNELYRWALSAKNDSKLENGGKGKLGMMWDEKQVWIRSKFPVIKAAYNERGENKRQVKTIEELGLDFVKWRKHAKVEDMQMFHAAGCPSENS